MQILAVLTTRNEIRFVDTCLAHLIANGVAVHVIDHASSDGTVEAAERWLGNGVVALDHQPWTGAFELREQLRRKQAVIEASRADWFLHLDADELREAPSPYSTLSEAVVHVDGLGYNAVDFDEFVFVPTFEDPDFDGPAFVERMRWYYHFEPESPDRHRTNLWKRTQGADLVGSAGHRIEFPGRRVFPRPFVMRHYPVLSEAHAAEKYGRRVFASDELTDQWHSDRVDFRAGRVRLPHRHELNELRPLDDDGHRSFDPLPRWTRHPFLDPDAQPLAEPAGVDPERERRESVLVAHASSHRPHIPTIEPPAPGPRPMWSVMIPAFNPQPRHLSEALRSVLAQDPGRDAMEIEVVDDASADGPALARLVEEVGGGRVGYRRNESVRGLAGNWNECLRRSRGEFVHLLHQDDRVAPGFYDRLGRPMRSDPSIVAAFCRVGMIDAEGAVSTTVPHEAAVAGVLAECARREATEHVMIVAGVVVRRGSYELIGAYRDDLPYCTDWDFLKRVSLLGPVWYDPEVLAFWRQHAAQESSRLSSTGADLADRRRSIELTAPLYAPELSAGHVDAATTMSLTYATEILARQVQHGWKDAALNQAREIVATLERIGSAPSDPERRAAERLAAAERRIESLEAQLKGWVAAVRLAQRRAAPELDPSNPSTMEPMP